MYITVVDSLGRYSDLTPEIFNPSKLRQSYIDLGVLKSRKFDIQGYDNISITIDMDKNIRKQLENINKFINVINNEIEEGINKGVVGLYLFIKNYTSSKNIYLNLDIYGSRCELKYVKLEKYNGRVINNVFITVKCKMFFDYSKSGITQL